MSALVCKPLDTKKLAVLSFFPLSVSNVRVGVGVPVGENATFLESETLKISPTFPAECSYACF